MKNSFLYFLTIFCVISNFSLTAQELEINSSKIQYDNINKITILENDVNFSDEMGNKVFSEYAKYNKIKEVIETFGDTKIITSAGYEVYGKNIVFDNKKNLIYSNNKTKIVDKDGNDILVEMFNYSILNNIFFSKGNIEIKDINNNNYFFSEVYIDEQKKQIIGSDVKAFLNQPDISINPDNNPRFFANTMYMSKKTSTFTKGVFTYCKDKGNEKCPPWILQSKKIRHDLAKKTVYYDNVVLKVYDFPIFFFPKFSHPDPTVDRRSGLLAPTLTNSTSLGSGFSIPYFWNIGPDKDITISPKFYSNENPLFLTEYRQAFINSYLVVDAGFTQGYKNNTKKKTKGSRSHLFTNFNMSFIDEKDKVSDLEINIEKVSNDTYLKVYNVETLLADKEKTILENKLNFTYQNKDFYLGIAPSVFEDTGKSGHLRHEYLLPLNVEKKIMESEKYGFVDLQSSLALKNYETNKQSNLLVNRFNWQSNKWLDSLGIEKYFSAIVKAVNYDTKKTTEFKNDDLNSEINSVFGLFSKLPLYKEDFINKNFHSLTPKVLLRYAPGHMRKIQSGRLNYGNLFSLNKINDTDVVESGLSTSVGIEYKKNKLNESNVIENEILSLSVGQVISPKENMDIPASSSMDQRFSDIVGETKYNVNNKLKLNYNFSIDQGYKNFNYNEIGADIEFGTAKFNLDYLQEKNHIGSQEYIKTGLDLKLNNNSELSFGTKRNLLTSSAEFYNLSYNYINDCLKAGIAYRREFYTDRDVEPANTLMFTISIVPFAQINSPSLTK
jgi:LPS-assembly protein